MPASGSRRKLAVCSAIEPRTNVSGDELKQLLRTADAHGPAAPLHADDLSARVQRRLARRRQRQATAVTLGVFILVGVGVFTVLRDDPPTQRNVIALPATTVTAPARRHNARPRRRGRRLRLTATLHELTAQRLLAASARAFAAAGDVLRRSSDPQLLRDRAALVLVYDADRDVRENRPADARARYRRAIELFPHTHWAQVARQRLKEIQT